MVRRAALAAEVLRRARAAARGAAGPGDAWRTAYAEELRSDRIKAALAARAAAELLARLAAQKAMEGAAAARIQAPWRGKLGRDAFERMLDEAMVEITKIADADDTEDVYEQLLLLALKKPPPPPKPPPEPDDPVYDGEDEAACGAFLKFMLKQTPPPPYCMEDPKAHLRNLAKNLPRRKLDLGQPPEPPIESTSSSRYKDHPECPRIDFDFKDDWADPKFGR
ncbi:hypothetical protein SO694_00080067 [Aureococcus anophagefferens]|uniref:Uncharacterized protein n=1 Tax=Aureococcus anophagefferens TaxID=44056 RepID=A0ABR1G597_AURAN